MVTEHDWLGVLKVRAARHDRVGVPGCLCHKDIDQVECQQADNSHLVAEEQPYQRGDLVVPRPPCADPAADVGTGDVEKRPLERRVDVLVVGVGPQRPVSHLLAQPAKRRHQRCAGLVVEQTCAVQGPHVRDRPDQVVVGQPEVEVRGDRQSRKFR